MVARRQERQKKKKKEAEVFSVGSITALISGVTTRYVIKLLWQANVPESLVQRG